MKEPLVSTLGPVINSNVFTRQMEHLKRHYNVISIDECIEALKGKRPLKPYSVAITFDDGYANQYRYAFPVLKRLGLKATFFITTSFVGTRNLFWWDELEYMLTNCEKNEIHVQIDGEKMLFRLGERDKRKQLSGTIANGLFRKVDFVRRDKLMQLFRDATAVDVSKDEKFIENYRCMDKDMIEKMMGAGMQFGSHAVHHPILPNESYAVQQQEVEESIKYLDASRPLHFCYPNGSFNADT